MHHSLLTFLLHWFKLQLYAVLSKLHCETSNWNQIKLKEFHVWRIVKQLYILMGYIWYNGTFTRQMGLGALINLLYISDVVWINLPFWVRSDFPKPFLRFPLILRELSANNAASHIDLTFPYHATRIGDDEQKRTCMFQKWVWEKPGNFINYSVRMEVAVADLLPHPFDWEK